MNQFDSSRMIFLTEELTPKPLTARELVPLVGALDAQAEVLCLPLGKTALALNIFEMMYHHVAQGETHGQPWVVSLCMLCNAGNIFSPMVDGQVLRFSARAIYDGMMMLVDAETQSCWNHITGECQYGQHLGKRLALLSDARQMSAAQALALYPDAWLIQARLTPKREAIATEHAAFRQDPHSNKGYLDAALATLGAVDPRLPRLEMGLGVWNNAQGRFYPFRQLSAADNMVFDTFMGKRLVVYVDPQTSIPCAVYLDAEGGRWKGDGLRLSNGYEIRNGLVYDQTQQQVAVVHPLQLFMRWFGFAFSFPDCEVFAKTE